MWPTVVVRTAVSGVSLLPSIPYESFDFDFLIFVVGERMG